MTRLISGLNMRLKAFSMLSHMHAHLCTDCFAVTHSPALNDNLLQHGGQTCYLNAVARYTLSHRKSFQSFVNAYVHLWYLIIIGSLYPNEEGRRIQ